MGTFNYVPNDAPVYITKYGLTVGIYEVPAGEGNFVDGTNKRYFSYRKNPWDFFVGPKDYALTREEAEERVRAMTKRRINTLEKTIKMLQVGLDRPVKVKLVTTEEK